MLSFGLIFCMFFVTEHMHVPLLQLKDDEERIEDEEAENRKKLKASREHHKNWEQNRDGRVGTWRTFVDKKKKKVCP